jgi:hypothetical protein
MQDSNIPTKFPIPWANGAGSPYINPVPTPSQQGIKNGAASLTDGFPPNCFIAYAAGGAGPFGADTNGILNQITAWLQWAQAGGPITYDGTFQAAIGGYPKGTVIASGTTAGLLWLSTVDNNTSDPDTGGANWTKTIALQNPAAVAFTGGTINFLSACSISTTSSAAGFSATATNPVFEWIDHATGNAWVFEQNSSNAQLNVSFNLNGLGTFDHISGVYTATSDERLKENIESLPATLDRVMKLNPVSFSFKSDVDKRPRTGFLAQEMQALFPEFVLHVANKSLRPRIERERLDHEKRHADDNEPVVEQEAEQDTSDGIADKLGIDYAGLSVISLKATQETNTKFDARVDAAMEVIQKLTAEVAALRDEVAALKDAH